MPISSLAWMSGGLMLFAFGASLTAQGVPEYRNPQLPVEQRINSLLRAMTLDEKIECLGTRPDVPRLGVKGSGHVEGLHGLAQGGPAKWGGKQSSLPTTQFPQAVGLGETWDPELLQKAAAVEAEEARYIFQSPKFRNELAGPYAGQPRGGIVVRAPNSDLARDPRWGRSEESYGEDPYLVGSMAVAFTRGLQGENPKYWESAALLKHFLANSNENGRDWSSSDFDARLLHEYYSVPFRMAIQTGGADAFMTAYNAMNGIPMTASPILKNLVMARWGFNGIICTDAGALTNMVTQHRYARDLNHAAADALHAGIDQFLDKYKEAVRGALAQNLITPAEIDSNLRGVFRVMIRLGLLDPPSDVSYAGISAVEGKPDPWDTDTHKAIARQITEESIVLLKNEKQLLPLDKATLRSVAVIGPRADEVDLDWYSGTPPYTITPLAAIRQKAAPNLTVNYAADNAEGAAVRAAEQSDVALVFVGNHPTCNAGWAKCPEPSDGKEAIDRRSLALPDEDLIQQVFAVNPRTVVVLVSSFPFAANWTKAHIPAILHLAHNSQEEGTAVAEALFGDINPAGRLVTTWPSSMAQLPQMMDYILRDGRTYMYFKGESLFPFGYGLSYSKFEYKNLRTSAKQLRQNSSIAVDVDVTNAGSRAGDEVVQLYVQHVGSRVERPREELKGFRRVHLRAGETKTVRLDLKAADLAYWNESENNWSLEADRVQLAVGASSADLRLKQAIQVSN